MSTISYFFEELELGGGVAIATGTAEISYDFEYFGSYDIEAISFLREVGMRAEWGICPFDVQSEQFPAQIRMLAPGNFRKVAFDLPTSDPLFAIIATALRDKHDGSICEAMEQGGDTDDYSQHSTLNHVQQGIGRL